MYITILCIFFLVSISLIGMIMLQQGKSAGMGASCSTSASATLFGSPGSGDFMTRMSVIFAALFFVISLILGNLTSNKSITGSKWENISEPVKVTKLSRWPTISTNDIPH